MRAPRTRANRPTVRRPKSSRRHLSLESLEDRRLLTTYSSYPQDYTVVGDQAFFAANDGVRGFALWKTGGTNAGTTLVKDIQPSDVYAKVSNLQDLINVSGTLFFTRATGMGSSEQLWKSDGTPGGTELVKTLRDVSGLVNVGGTLFFAATDATHGNELWKSDGTAGGTLLVEDIVPGPDGSNPNSLVNFKGALFFASLNASNVRELWTSAGSAAVTNRVTDFGPGGKTNGVLSLTSTGNGLFAVRDENEFKTGLFVSDGTAAGTTLLADFTPIQAEQPRRPSDITQVGDTTYFGINTNKGAELFKTDGTAAGTAEVTRYPHSSYYGTPYLRSLTNLNGTLVFSTGTTYQYGVNEIWKTNGTEAGTTRITYFYGGGEAPYLTNVGGTLFFALSTQYQLRALWKSDGTSSGTQIVKNFSPSITDNQYSAIAANRHLVNLGDTFLFTADGGYSGFEPWQASITTHQATLLKDVNTINGSPVILDIGPPPTYREKDPPVALLGPKTTFNYTSNYLNAELQVLYQGGRGPNDRLNIRNEGVGPGQIGVSGSQVTYEGVLIGQRVGTGSQSLVVKFEPTIFKAAIQALLKAITYENANRTSLQSASRMFQIRLIVYQHPNSSRVDSFTIFRPLQLVGFNDAPKLQGSGSPTYQLNASSPPIRVLYDVQVADPDSQNFAGGQLAIRYLAGASADNFFVLSGTVHFDGQNNLYRGSQIIGTRLPGGGSGVNDLVIALNENANAAGITEFLVALRFGTRSPGTRELSYTLSDGDGGTSNAITSTINVPANAAPVLTAGDPVTNPPNSLNTMFQGATVTDADSPNFSGGTLLLSYDIHRSGDHIQPFRAFAVDFNHYLILNTSLNGPLVIGRLTSSSLSSSRVEFTFNAQATAARVQWLLNSFLFNPSDISLPRNISVTLTDGDGGTSNTIVRRFG